MLNKELEELQTYYPPLSVKSQLFHFLVDMEVNYYYILWK